MSTVFAINFRREAYLQAQARARRRVIALAVWVAYFGVLAIVVGLYALNAWALSRQIRQTERQAEQIRRIQNTGGAWTLSAAEFAQVERWALNPRDWHDRLARLSRVLPQNVRLSTLTANPENGSTPYDEKRIVMTGQLLPAAGHDRMQDIMKMVNDLHRDSLFSSHYSNVKLTSTRVVEGTGGAAEFVVECR